MTTIFPNSITEDDIANYLANAPDFFERHAELLAAVQLTSPHSNRAVSLQERQATLLRDKIKGLESRTMDMIRHGNENVMLLDKLLQWARTLFLVVDPLDLPARMATELEQEFLVPQVGIKVWGVSPDFAHADFAQAVGEDIKIFTSSLNEPYCGLNTGFDALSCLSDPLAAKSVAILPLRAGLAGSGSPAFGVLVLASSDAQRFNSTMGTDFLIRLAELSSAALSRLTPR
jgi:uncharacterized protein YigA (DUF484 family)